MLKRPAWLPGRVVVLEHVSRVLQGNPLSKRLQAAGIPHTYEEFDDTHSDIDSRMDVSLPFLTRALR